MRSSLLMILTGCGMLASTATFAQQEWLPDGTLGHPAFTNSVGITVGTQGVGVEVGTPLSTRFNLRLSTSLLPYEGDVVKKFNSSYNYDTDFKVEFMNFSGFIDWQPFPNAGVLFRKFALTAGGAYFYKAGGTAKVMLNEPYYVGDIPFTPEEVGVINTTVDWKGWAPYAGLGWQNLVIAGGFNMGVNLGAYYIGDPDIKMTATNWLSSNPEVNEPILRRNLKDYKWLPKFEIKFAYNY